MVEARGIDLLGLGRVTAELVLNKTQVEIVKSRDNMALKRD